MHQDNIPSPHCDPWIDLTRGYVTAAVRALAGGGLRVERSWLDPRDPRDATIIVTHPASAAKLALVWDEVAGWRRGAFAGGGPGARTRLAGTAYLGGGLLPGGPDLARRVLAGASEPRREYRSAAALRDGLDDMLIAWDRR